MTIYHLLTGCGEEFASNRPGCKFLCGLVAEKQHMYRFTSWYLSGGEEDSTIQWCQKCVDNPRLALQELAQINLGGDPEPNSIIQAAINRIRDNHGAPTETILSAKAYQALKNLL